MDTPTAIEVALPNVLICGTPGCGKTSVCEVEASRVGGALKHINVGEGAARLGYHAGRDGVHGALLIDEASEDLILDDLEPTMKAGGVLLEHHTTDFFPERWFDLVIVLRSDNTILFDRLTAR